MHLKLGHTISAPEIYTNVPKSVFDKQQKWYSVHCKSTRPHKIMGTILGYFMRLVIEDIVRNNIKFEFPNTKNKAFLEMDAVVGEEFKKHRERGAFQDIDFWASNFTGYNIKFYYKCKNYTRYYQLYFNRKVKILFNALVNAGKKY